MKRSFQRRPARPADGRRAGDLVRALDVLARGFMRQAVRAREPDLPLTRQEFRVLVMIGGAAAGTMGELAARTLVSVSRLTSVVDRLVAKGLVVRTRSERDRRVVRVGLTARGRALHEQGRRHRLRMAAAMLGPLSPGEQAQFLGLMQKIGEHLQGQAAPGRAA